MADFLYNNSFNRFVNLDNIEWNVIDHLVKSDSKYANYLWKILNYADENCLYMPNLAPNSAERKNLIYTNNGDSSVKRVFMTPFTDDAWTEVSSHLHIFVHRVTPKDHLSSVVDIGVETIVHNKISNIVGDADIRQNPEDTNPAEIDDNLRSYILYKNRATVMLKCVLAEFNGTFVNGVGTLQFNSKLSPYNNSSQQLWNRRNFLGHMTFLSTIISGASVDTECGY